MPNPLMLEGEVIDPLPERIAELEAENDGLRADLQAVQRQLLEARREAARAVAKLRQVLKPQYDALRMLFGEMDAILGEETPEAPKSNARWESWKQRMPGRPAEMIDLLLLHGSMSVKNLMAAMHCGKDAVYQAASKLGQAGVITNNGGRYSLKD